MVKIGSSNTFSDAFPGLFRILKVRGLKTIYTNVHVSVEELHIDHLLLLHLVSILHLDADISLCLQLMPPSRAISHSWTHSMCAQSMRVDIQ